MNQVSVSELFEELMEINTDSIKIIDCDWRCIYLNDRAAKVSSLPKEEQLGRYVWDLFPEYIGASYQHFLQKSMEEKIPVNFELTGQSDKHYEISSYPFSGGIIVCTRDITEKKKMEKALEASEKKFSALFHAIPCPVTLKRKSDGRFVEVNQAFENSTELSKEEALKLTSRDMIWDDPENPVVRMHEDEKLITQGIKNLELRKIRQKSGKEFIGLFSSSVVDINQEEYILSMALDITEKKQAEKKYRLSEERFAKVFRSSPVMMAIIDHRTRHILDVNDYWLTLTHYDKEEVIGKTLTELNLVAGLMCPERILKIFNGEMDKEVILIRKKSGEIMEVLTSSEVIEFQGEKCLLLTGVDITEKNRYEKELAKIDTLKMIGQVAGGISHEIRNPMTTVRGFLQIMRQKEKFDRDKEIIDLMISELDRANGIITDFLSLSSTSSPKIRQDLNTIVLHLFPLLQAEALAAGKEIILDLAGIPEIELNAKEIKQLILNLVQNAVEASGRDGMIKIRTAYQDNQVILVIEDRGEGIPAELLAKLGTPFLTTKEEGTGLGLAVCYAIVDRHKGKINVQTSNKGTTFSVYLPV